MTSCFKVPNIMDFDNNDNSESIEATLSSDAMIDILTVDQLSECLKYTLLNVSQSINVLKKVQSKYNIFDRLKVAQHIFTDFGKGDSFDSDKFVEYLTEFGRCLNIEYFESIIKVFQTAFSIVKSIPTESIPKQHSSVQTQTQFQQIMKSIETQINPQVSSKETQINQQVSATDTQIKPQVSSIETQTQLINRYIEELKSLVRGNENFDKFYDIFKRIAKDNDHEAMDFGVKEQFCYLVGSNGDNLILKATRGNNVKLVRMMVESKIDIKTKQNQIHDALILASKNNFAEVVKILSTVPGININAQNKNRANALLNASKKGHVEVVKHLLQVDGINVNIKNSYHLTPLELATKHCHTDVVRLLVKAPGIANATPALELASEKGYHEIVKLLRVPDKSN